MDSVSYWFTHKDSQVPVLQKYDDYPSVIFVGITNPPINKNSEFEIDVEVVSYMNSKVLRDYFGKEKVDEFVKHIQNEKENISKKYLKENRNA